MFKTWMYCMQLMPSAKTFITTTLQQVHRKLVISIQSLFYMNLSGESTKQFISVNKSIVIIGREQEKHMAWITGKNNGFPFLDIFGYLKNTHKNLKFGRVRQVPIWELGWEYSLNTQKYPKMGIRYFFLWMFLF